jgi:uncharacterized protein
LRVPDGIAICNTGPLIALAKIQRVSVLTKLFAEILIPQAIADELKAGGPSAIGAQLSEQFRVVECRPDPLLESALDFGEACVIQLAIQNPGAEVVLDEKKARRLATSVYGLDVLGTGGLLLRAKRRGLVPKIRPLLTEIRTKGYFLSDRLFDGLVRAAGE